METYVTINPGAGPVHGASEKHAVDNMTVWCADHSWDDMRFQRMPELDSDGRFGFEVWRDSVPRGGRGIRLRNSTHTVEMPGLPVDEVRYINDDQNIWHFPRLYVDGGSWVWRFSLLNEEEYWDPSPETGQD